MKLHYYTWNRGGVYFHLFRQKISFTSPFLLKVQIESVGAKCSSNDTCECKNKYISWGPPGIIPLGLNPRSIYCVSHHGLKMADILIFQCLLCTCSFHKTKYLHSFEKFHQGNRNKQVIKWSKMDFSSVTSSSHFISGQISWKSEAKIKNWNDNSLINYGLTQHL